MTTTDPFTEAARAEAERQFPTPFCDTAWSRSEVQIKRALWESGAEWARTHLAAQEPTDAEVLAALNADFAIRHPLASPSDTLDDYGDWHVDAMRATLSAARAARRDEETP